MLGILSGLRASWAHRPAFASQFLSNDEAVTLPAPLPAPAESGVAGHSIGAPARIGITFGTAGDDRLEVRPGGMAFGGGGDDVFVLSGDLSGHPWRPMAFITDYDQGDRLDLSRLGENARMLDTLDLQDGRSRIGIDVNSDGAEDGYLIVGAIRLDLDGYRPMPMPEPRPLPVEPPNAFDPGSIGGPVSAPPQGEVRILPVDGWVFP